MKREKLEIPKDENPGSFTRVLPTSMSMLSTLWGNCTSAK